MEKLTLVTLLVVVMTATLVCGEAGTNHDITKRWISYNGENGYRTDGECWICRKYRLRHYGDCNSVCYSPATWAL